ncbi:MAG: DUF3306 domain-containing protein [Thiolinea sp.]
MSNNEQDIDTKQEGFLGRWARRKAAAQAEHEQPVLPEDTPTPPPVATEEGLLQQDSEDTEAPLPNKEASANPPLTDADMPPLETLTEDSDYTGFMSPEVSEELRKLALRKLFQGSAFHHRDGLDDYDDDFTKFAKLGDIVTSDMKHMAEVEAKRALEASMKNNSNNNGEVLMQTPRQAALANLEQFNADPTGQVEYQSQGSVLLIGGETAIETAIQLEMTIPPKVLLTEDSESANGNSFVTPRGERDIELSGWLGNFEARLTDKSGKTETLQADIVLDFSADGYLQQPLKPPGYFHPGTDQDETQLTATLAEVSELKGTFAKPRYFDYNADICAHSSSGLPGCQRCIEACPTEAIISIGAKIEVNPHLCQGGGTCATVCPTGAIRYNYPAPGHHINQLRRMLNAWRDAGGEDVTLLLHSSENPLEVNSLPQHILPFELEELASAGAELWAAALSFGAKQILLLDDEQTPVISRQSLRHQLSILSTQLSGLGYPDNVVRLIPALPADVLEQQSILEARDSDPLMPYFPPATQAGMNDKRQQWMLALDHLYKHAPQAEDNIPLPTGSPFGTLKVDQEKCTLCMACTTICPAQALSGGSESPQLRIHPANCVQCGLCASGCPEQAIKLQPQYIANRELRQRPQLLHEESAFNCISCGKPFASQKIISTMLAKLQEHYMFQNDRAKQRLKMCEDCRVVDIVQDDEAMGQPSLGTIMKG